VDRRSGVSLWEAGPSNPSADVDKDKTWHELHRYWLDKHVEGKPPARRDLDPLVEIPSLVAWIMLVEVEGR